MSTNNQPIEVYKVRYVGTDKTFCFIYSGTLEQALFDRDTIPVDQKPFIYGSDGQYSWLCEDDDLTNIISTKRPEGISLKGMTYLDVEQKIYIPQLTEKGYQVLDVITTDSDSFGPLHRVFYVLTPENKVRVYGYG